jgi:SAM-dependent methyltransferase
MKKTDHISLYDFMPPVLSGRLKHVQQALQALRSRILYPAYSTQLEGRYLYFGNLGKVERQYQEEKFVGLALVPLSSRDILHNAYNPLPCRDGSIPKIQSQDVFEHLEFQKIPRVLDEIYRVLAPGGIFRLSLPDYNSPIHRQRCVFDWNGEILSDTLCGGSVVYDSRTQAAQAVFSKDGNAHLWFPTYELVRALILQSKIKVCTSIRFYHYFINAHDYVCENIPDLEMPVMRVPPLDMRAEGKPISIVVDFIK